MAQYPRGNLQPLRRSERFTKKWLGMVLCSDVGALRFLKHVEKWGRKDAEMTSRHFGWDWDAFFFGWFCRDV